LVGENEQLLAIPQTRKGRIPATHRTRRPAMVCPVRPSPEGNQGPLEPLRLLRGQAIRNRTGTRARRDDPCGRRGDRAQRLRADEADRATAVAAAAPALVLEGSSGLDQECPMLRFGEDLL